MPGCKRHEINSFAISFFIDPKGNVKNLGSYDKITVKDFQTIGATYPQTSI